MKICGIELKGSDAIIAVAEMVDGIVSHILIETKKISLTDDEDYEQVQSFSCLLQGLVRDNGINIIAIKKRNKKGNYAGGAVTFKIEGIIQLLQGSQIILIAPTTIAAAEKRRAFTIPKSLNQYQVDAFKTAYTQLVK